MADQGVNVIVDADIRRMQAALAKAQADIAAFAKRSEGGMGGLERGIGSVGKALGGLAVADFALNIGKQIISVTAEFEKLRAVLSNALGSEMAGAAAFAQIQDFAAKTNFSVLEITKSFTLLANRGIKPSTENLTSLADVANSLGKPLDDVSQAILDVTNTERWNELGIKVSKSGDQITGTFRGVSHTFEATEQGALDMITAIGKMEGVAGVTDEVAKTLGGSISNLGDALDKMFDKIGSANSGILIKFIGLLTGAANGVARFLESDTERATGQALKDAAKYAEQYNAELKEQEKIYLNLGNSAEDATRKAKQFLSDDARKNIARTNVEISFLDQTIARLQLRLKNPTAETGPLALIDKQIKENEAKRAAELVKVQQYQQRLQDATKPPPPPKVDTAAQEAAAKAADAIAKVYADMQMRIKGAATQARLLGEEEDLLWKKTDILRDAIIKLADMGVSPADKRLRGLADTLRNLSASMQAAVPVLEPLSAKLKIDIDPSGIDTGMAAAFASLDAFAAGASDRLAALDERMRAGNASLTEAFAQTNELFAQFAGQGVSTFLNALEQMALADDGFKDFGTKILGAMGAFLADFGKMLIAQGVAFLAAQKLAANPVTAPAAIAAGAAALAIGLAMSSMAKRNSTTYSGAGGGDSPFAGVQGGFAGGVTAPTTAAAAASPVRAAAPVSGSQVLSVLLDGKLTLADEGGVLVGYIKRQEQRLKQVTG